MQLFDLYYANKHNYCFAFFGANDQIFISSLIYNKSLCQMFALLGPFLTKGHKLNKIIHSSVLVEIASINLYENSMIK